MQSDASEVAEVLDHLRKVAKARDKAARDERAGILAALQAGARQADVARAIDRSREHVRLVWDRWSKGQR